MRRAFGKAIAEIAIYDPKVHLIIGDTSYKVFGDFLENFPLQKEFVRNRLHNFGTCEQSMVGIASGMALEGRIQPWVYALTPFLVERAFEQIKIGVNLQRPDIKLIGYCDYPDEGPTHAMTEERIMDIFKNIKSYYPKDGNETKEIVREAHEYKGPVFISLKKDHSYK